MTESAAALLRLLAIIAAIAAAIYFERDIGKTIRAPAEAKLDAALGNNAAFKAGAQAQNAAVDARKAEGDRRKAQSRAAVKAAGEAELARAAAIAAAPADGATDYERAVNRIDRELGLR